MGKEKAELIHIAERFAMEGEIGSIEAHGNGHINDTFLVTCQMAEGKTRRYILQRMNQEVFKNPKELMENVTGVTTFLQNKIRENGGDPEREALNVILLKDGGSYWQEEDNTFWRVYRFVEGADSLDVVERPEEFYDCLLYTSDAADEL